MAIDGIHGLQAVLPTELTPAPVAAPPAGGGPGEVSFEHVLGSIVGDANRMSQAADAKVQALASGAIDDVHGTMIAQKEAEISMKLVGSIRNKLLDAFHEIWRTSV